MKDVIATSWTKQNGQWVAWNGQTRIMNGWVLYKDELYYIKDGFMLEDQLIEADGATYLLGKDGRCLYRWQKVNGKWAYFYFDDGTMVKDKIVIGKDGKLYYLDKDGYLMTNFDARFAVNGELTIRGKAVDASLIINDGDANN